MLEAGWLPCLGGMAVGARRRCRQVCRCRGDGPRIANIGMAAGAVGGPSMVHGRWYPGAADRVATGAHRSSHRRYRVRLGPTGRLTGSWRSRIWHIVATRLGAVRCRSYAGNRMAERSRQPCLGGVAGQALRASRQVAGFCRCPGITGISMTGRTSRYPAVVHCRGDPQGADGMAAAATGAGHRRDCMCLGAGYRSSCRIGAVMARDSTVADSGDAAVTEGRWLPDRGCMAVRTLRVASRGNMADLARGPGIPR